MCICMYVHTSLRLCIAIMHQPVTVSSNMHVQMKQCLAHLQDFIPTLAGIKIISAKVEVKSCIYIINTLIEHSDNKPYIAMLFI